MMRNNVPESLDKWERFTNSFYTKYIGKEKFNTIIQDDKLYLTKKVKQIVEDIKQQNKDMDLDRDDLQNKMKFVQLLAIELQKEFYDKDSGIPIENQFDCNDMVISIINIAKKYGFSGLGIAVINNHMILELKGLSLYFDPLDLCFRTKEEIFIKHNCSFLISEEKYYKRMGLDNISEIMDSSELLTFSKDALSTLLLDYVAFLFDNKNYDKAINLCIITKYISPNDHLLYLHLGRLFARRNQFDKAEEVLLYGLKNITCNQISYYAELGTIYHLKKDYYKAERYYTKVLLEENDATTQYNLCELYYDKGDFFKCYEYLSDFFSDHKKDVNPIKWGIELMGKLGEKFLENKNYNKSIECFDAILRFSQIDSQAFFYLGYNLLLSINDIEKIDKENKNNIIKMFRKSIYFHNNNLEQLLQMRKFFLTTDKKNEVKEIDRIIEQLKESIK